MRFAPLALVVPVLAACDSGSSTSVKPFNASASDETVVATLDAAGRTTLCQEVKAYYASEISEAMSKKIACYGLALAFTSDATACKQAAQACLADDSGEVSTGGDECDPNKADGCQATVLELEGCYTAMAERIKTFGAKVSCTLNPNEIPDFDTPPAACAAVQAKCPSLIESDTTEEP